MTAPAGELTLDQLFIGEVTSNPSVAPGITAAIGAVCLALDGTGLYVKNTTADTGWVQSSIPFSSLQYTAHAPLSMTVASTASGILQLTATSPSVVYITGSATGFTVKLPDATTCSVSQSYEIYNQASVPINVNDGSGASLFTLGQTSIGTVRLQINTTAAGTWISYQVFASSTASGLVNYNVTANTSFATSSTTDVQITGFSVTPIAGTYAAFFSASGTNTADTTSTIYLGTTAIADSVRTLTGPSGSHKITMTSMTVAQWDGVKTASVYVNTSSSTLTITGRSLILLRLGP